MLDEFRLVLAALQAAPRHQLDPRLDDECVAQPLADRVREVVSAFAPLVSGNVLVRPTAAGVKQEPPLPVSVELAQGAEANTDLARSIGERIRNALVVQARVELVPWGSLQRSEYKSTLVETRPEGDG